MRTYTVYHTIRGGQIRFSIQITTTRHASAAVMWERLEEELKKRLPEAKMVDWELSPER